MKIKEMTIFLCGAALLCAGAVSAQERSWSSDPMERAGGLLQRAKAKRVEIDCAGKDGDKITLTLNKANHSAAAIVYYNAAYKHTSAKIALKAVPSDSSALKDSPLAPSASAVVYDDGYDLLSFDRTVVDSEWGIVLVASPPFDDDRGWKLERYLCD